MILLIDNYDSFTFNLVHYFGVLGVCCDVRRNDSLSVEEAFLLKPKAIVISPGPCGPQDAGICCELIQKMAGKIPILGVCLGHQAIGAAFGAEIICAQEPRHGKVSAIYHDGTGLFHGVSQAVEMARYHSLVLKEETLPPDLIVNARTKEGVIMGVRHKSFPLHGVQFHPESIASQEGQLLLKNFISLANL